MGNDDTKGDASHLQRASESTRLGLLGLVDGVYHLFIGASAWTKRRHVVVQAGITAVITIALAAVVNEIGKFFFETFWEQAVYASGLKLRLLPVPLTLVIYALFGTLLYLAYSFDSSIRELESELEDVKAELERRDE